MDRVSVSNMQIYHLQMVYLLGKSIFSEESPLCPRAPWSEECVAELFSRHPELCFVALQKKKLIGFTMGSTRETSSGTCGSIDWLCACEEGEVKGMLCDAVLQEMKNIGIRSVYIGARADNERDTGFCRSRGFVERGQVILMELTIDT